MLASRVRRALLVGLALMAGAVGGIRAQSAVVYGTVYDSIMDAPLANAAVFLWDSPYRAVTDSAGGYRIEGFPAGDYSLLFFHERLGEMGASVGPHPIRLAPTDRLRVDLGTPSTFTLVSSECLLEPGSPGTGVIAGRVDDGSSGMGLPGAQVTLSWDVEGEPNPERLHLRTNSNGWYLTCDAPATMPISIATRFMDRQGRLWEVSVVDNQSSEAGFLLYELEPTQLFGRLLDAASGVPVTEAVVWLRGTSFRALTDNNGRFQMKDVPPGDYMLISDHLAYGTKMDTLAVPSGQTLSLEMMIDTRAIDIAPLTVIVDATSISERAMGGIKITAAAITKVRQVARDAADLMRSQHIPDVIVRRRDDGSLCVGFSTGQVRMMFNSGCVPMMVFLNDARASTDLALNLPPDAVDRMVVYKPIEAGLLFGLGGGNGVFMIYTKGN